MKTTFSVKAAHAHGRQVTAEELAADVAGTLKAQWPGIEAGDYIVEYSSRPGVQVHEKRTPFENAWEPVSTDVDAINGRLDAIEEHLGIAPPT